MAGYLLWPESWHTRIGDRLADAVADTATYVECAFGTAVDAAARARMRRGLYRDLSVIRTEFQRALTEPPPTGARAAAWWPLVVAVERIVDATTAARVRIRHGAPPPAPAEVGEVARQLRELAGRLRASEILEEVDVDFTAAPRRASWSRCARRWRRPGRSRHRRVGRRRAGNCATSQGRPAAPRQPKNPLQHRAQHPLSAR